MTNCPREYRNLGVESFGNRKKVTEEMLAQFCKNDSYLYGKVKELFDLTDPESRKRHYPPFIDSIRSYNIKEKTDGTTKYYGFDNETKHKFNINFKIDSTQEVSYEDYIDLEKSTLEIDPVSGKCHLPLEDYDTELKWTEVKSETKVIPVKKTVKSYKKAIKDSYYEGPYGKYAPNGTWYAGYDYTKTYSIKAEWKKNPYNKNYKIPSLSRAQTFKAQNTGKIQSVTINVKADKKTNYPLRVEIRKTDKRGYPTSEIIGYSEKKFTHTELALESFTFKSAPVLTKGVTYAIVIRCPLAPYSSSYHIAGWQLGCYTKTTKQALITARNNKGVGYSFESKDNCNTWLKYNSGDGAGYSSSLKNPVAFGYEIKIKPQVTNIVDDEEEITVTTTTPMSEIATTQARKINTPYHLFFKPLRFENIINILSRLENVDNFDDEYSEITHHVSNDGINWYAITHNNTGITHPFTNNPKDYVFYRITIKLLKHDPQWNPQGTGTPPSPIPQTVDDNFDDNPTFKGIYLEIDSSLPSKAYLRTLPYVPISDEMLPSCIWSEFNSNYDLETGTNCEVDIIRDLEETLSYTLAKPTLCDLCGYSISLVGSTAKYVRDNNKIDYIALYKQQGGESSELLIDDFKVEKYVDDNPNFKKWILDNYNIFIIFSHYNRSSRIGDIHPTIQLPNFIAYPSIECCSHNEPVYLLSEDFTTTNQKLYSDKIYNFPEQIQSVEICKVNSDTDILNGAEPYEVVYTLKGGLTSNNVANLEDYLKITSVQGYKSGDNFYTDDKTQTSATLIEPVENKKYVDLTNSPTLVYYYYNSSASPKYVQINDISTTDAEWEISTNIGHEWNLKINYDELNPTQKTTYFEIIDDSAHLKKGYIIKVTLFDNDMIEGIDYEIDYDNSILRFYNEEEDGESLEGSTPFVYSYDSFHAGTLRYTYTPLWVKGLTKNDYPLSMDLWVENYLVRNGNVHKIHYDLFGEIVIDETYISPVDNYVLYTSVNPVDNLREFLINEETDNQVELIEDSDFVVDYLSKKVNIKKSLLNEEDIITIRYTPDLREFGLSVGFRLSRSNNSNDVKIKNYYFTTRT